MWIPIIVALVGGSLATKIWEHLTAQGKEKRHEQNKAWVERDKEASKRRIFEEYAHALRRLLFRHGFSVGPGRDDVPRWPSDEFDQSPETTHRE